MSANQTQIDLRSTLHSAYTALRSDVTNKAISALTLDHLIEQHIAALEGGAERPLLDARGASIGSRRSRLDELTDLEEKLKGIANQITSAGSNSDTLRSLGIFEVDAPTDVRDGSDDDLRREMLAELKKGM